MIEYHQRKDGKTRVSVRVWHRQGTGPGRERTKPQTIGYLPPSPTRQQRKSIAAQAKKREQELELAIRNGQDPTVISMTVGGLIDRWLLEFRTLDGHRAGSYQQDRAAAWRQHLPLYVPANDLTPEHVLAFRRVREKEAPATVGRDLAYLSSCYRWAKALGWVDHDPADPEVVRRPREARPTPNPLTWDDEAALTEQAVPWLRPIIQTAILTGMDRSELVAHRQDDRPGLRWSDVDWADRMMTIPRAKTGVVRKIPIEESLAAILAPLRQDTFGQGSVFRLADGSPASLSAAKSAMRRAWRAVPGKTRPWKSLRATFATRAHQAGLSVAEIATLMGLSVAHVLEHYVKVDERGIRKAMAKMDRWSTDRPESPVPRLDRTPKGPD